MCAVLHLLPAEPVNSAEVTNLDPNKGLDRVLSLTRLVLNLGLQSVWPSSLGSLLLSKRQPGHSGHRQWASGHTPYSVYLHVGFTPVLMSSLPLAPEERGR